jgi:hypothetical protein
MADDETQAETEQEKAAARGARSSAPAKSETVRYSADELAANPRLLGTGISRHAVRGALENATKRTFTIDEATKAVDRFLKSEPKSEDAEGDA